MLIRQKDKEELINLFNACISVPIEVWAYGSRVNGSAHSASDIDLVIRGPKLQTINRDEFIQLKTKIKESNIPVLVEINDWANLPESFHRQIEKKYELIYSTLEIDFKTNQPKP